MTIKMREQTFQQIEQQQAEQAPAPAQAADGGQQPAPAAPREGELLLQEFSPFPDDTPKQDGDFIMATLFGDGAKEPAGDQGAAKSSAQPAGGGAEGGAPPPATPAAPASGGGGAGSPAPLGTGAPQQQGSGQAPSPAPGQQPQGQQPQPQPQPAAQPGPQPAPELAILQASLQALQQQNAFLQQQLQSRQGQQPQGNQQPGQGGQPQADPAQETLSLVAPVDVVQAIFSDDPAMQQRGINHLISAVATHSYQRAMASVSKVLDDRFAGFSTNMAARSTAEAVEREYYAAFPAHNNPLFRDLIGAEYQAMQASIPGLQWNADTRNALGQRVAAKLQSLGFNAGQQTPQQQNQQQQQAPAEQPPVAFGGKKPAAMLDGGTRPPANDAAGNFIAATLG